MRPTGGLWPKGVCIKIRVPEMANQILAANGAKNIVCICYGPDHDIVGGRNAGLDTVQVRTGIHASDPRDEVIERCCDNDCVTNYLLSKFEFQSLEPSL